MFNKKKTIIEIIVFLSDFLMYLDFVNNKKFVKMPDNISIKKKNISLIGLMGSGKSMIGKHLAKEFGLKFYDSDVEIEKITKKSINLIFEEYGEPYFREIESKVCLNLLNEKNCIISLGGGAILDKKIRNKIKSDSYCIYLKVKIDELIQRLKRTTRRPLLKNVDVELKIDTLYKNRKIYYNKANLIIENNGNKNETLDIIKKKLIFR